MELADEFLSLVAEHFLGRGIDQQNGPGAVDDDDPFGERLQEWAHRSVTVKKFGDESDLPLNSCILLLRLILLRETGFGHGGSPVLDT